MDLTTIIFSCAAAVGVAKVVDFLLGSVGRRHLKNALIFQPWFSLQAMQPLSILQSAARWFSVIINMLFGRRLISYRAWLASVTMGTFTMPLYILLDKPLGLSEHVDHESSYLVLIGALVLINPAFDFASFAITRNLAQRIVSTKLILPALLLWIIDLLCCLAIAVTTFFIVDSFTVAVEPRHGLSIWFGYETRDFSVFTAATGFVPTIIHIVFFVVAFVAALIEVFRRVLCFLLERFDESDQSPLTVLATFFAVNVGILSTAAKLWPSL